MNQTLEGHRDHVVCAVRASIDRGGGVLYPIKYPHSRGTANRSRGRGSTRSRRRDRRREKAVCIVLFSFMNISLIS